MSAKTSAKPKASQFLTADGIHNAMRQWAAAQKRPSLKVQVTYSDQRDENDVYTDTFQPATKEVFYRLADGHELYTQAVDTPLYECWLSDEPINQRELKRRVEVWLGDTPPGVSITKILWTKEL